MNKILLALALLVAVPTAWAEPLPPPATSPRDGIHDFDFMHGTWKIAVKRLKNPLRGGNEWYEVSGTVVCKPIWGGQANIEEGDVVMPDGKHAESLMVRMYNPTSRQWSLNWVTPQGPAFGVPTVGEFKDGRGEFYDMEDWNGRWILVRYVWSDIKPNSAHFEQAFSTDGGKTWEVNWIAQNTRVSK